MTEGGPSCSVQAVARRCGFSRGRGETLWCTYPCKQTAPKQQVATIPSDRGQLTNSNKNILFKPRRRATPALTWYRDSEMESQEHLAAPEQEVDTQWLLVSFLCECSSTAAGYVCDFDLLGRSCFDSAFTLNYQSLRRANGASRSCPS